MRVLVLGMAIAVLISVPARTQRATTAAAPGPVVVMDTAKGVIEIQLFPEDAPKSVARILELVNKGFYRGLRMHRVTPSLVQFGDPLTRDMSKRDYWGSNGSGVPIGVAEISKRRKHQRGTVGLAHAGAAKYADSQLYIMKAASPSLDGVHTIVGQVTKGIEVVDKLQVPDVIKTFVVK